MKILISVMGILGIFSSCTSRKESLTEKKKSTLKEVKMKKDSSCFDTDMLPVPTRVMTLLEYIIEGLILKPLTGVVMILLMALLLQDYPMVL